MLRNYLFQINCPLTTNVKGIGRPLRSCGNLRVPEHNNRFHQFNVLESINIDTLLFDSTIIIILIDPLRQNKDGHIKYKHKFLN